MTVSRPLGVLLAGWLAWSGPALAEAHRSKAPGSGDSPPSIVLNGRVLPAPGSLGGLDLPPPPFQPEVSPSGAGLLMGFPEAVPELDAPSWIPPVDSPVLRESLRRFDADEDGKLTFDEWSKRVRYESQAPLDLDGDDAISAQEFATSLAKVSQSLQDCDESALFSTMAYGAAEAAQGKYWEAATCYRQVLAAAPTSPTAYLGLGRMLESADEAGMALEAYRQDVRADPNFADGWLGLGLLELKLASTGRGVTVTGTAPLVEPASQGWREHLWRGLHLLELSARVGVLAVEPAADGGPGRLARLEWGESQEALEDAATALDVLDPALAATVRIWGAKTLGPRLRPAPEQPSYCEMARLVGTGRAPALLHQMESLPAGPSATWQTEVARYGALTCVGRYEPAALSLEKAGLHGGPDILLRTLTAVNWLDRGQREKAVKLLDGLAKQRLTQLQEEELAWQLVFRREFDLARTWLETANEVRNERNMALVVLAEEQAGMHEQARRDASHLGGPLSADPAARVVEARLLLKFGMPEKASQLTDELIRELPDCVDPWELMAEVAAAEGSAAGSLAAYEKALELCPKASPRAAELTDRLKRLRRKLTADAGGRPGGQVRDLATEKPSLGTTEKARPAGRTRGRTSAPPRKRPSR